MKEFFAMAHPAPGPPLKGVSLSAELSRAKLGRGKLRTTAQFRERLCTCVVCLVTGFGSLYCN